MAAVSISMAEPTRSARGTTAGGSAAADDQELLHELVGRGDHAAGSGVAGAGGDEVNELGGEIDVGELKSAAGDAAGAHLAGLGDDRRAGSDADGEEVCAVVDQ